MRYERGIDCGEAVAINHGNKERSEVPGYKSSNKFRLVGTVLPIIVSGCVMMSNKVWALVEQMQNLVVRKCQVSFMHWFLGQGQRQKVEKSFKSTILWLKSVVH